MWSQFVREIVSDLIWQWSVSKTPLKEVLYLARYVKIWSQHSGPVLAVVCIEYAFENRHLLGNAGQ